MKVEIKKLLLVFALSIASSGLTAQNPLIGAWHASCPIEKTSESSGNVCEICPVQFSKNKRDISIQDFEMQFEEKSVFFKTETDFKTAFYKWDDPLRLLEFKYNDRKYIFRVMVSNSVNLLVLKEAEGMLVVLERKH